jgi:ferredoxin
MPYYITDDCIDCGACLGVCPVDAILTARRQQVPEYEYNRDDPLSRKNPTPVGEPYSSIITTINDLTEAIRELSFTGGEINIPALGLKLKKLGKTLTINSI